MHTKNDILSFLYLPFRILGKNELSVQEYLNTLSFRLNKVPPTQTKVLLDLSIKNQFIILKNQKLTQSTKIDSVSNSDIHFEEAIDFLKKESTKPVLIRIAEIIGQKLNLTIKEVIAKVNIKQRELESLMPPEIVAISLAEEEGIDVSDLKSIVANKKE